MSEVKLSDAMKDLEVTALRVKAERDELVKTMELINTAACYASEEDTSARETALLLIGAQARAVLAKVKGTP